MHGRFAAGGADAGIHHAKGIQVIGAGAHYLESGVDGVIAVVAFGCGPDSVMLDVLQRHARRQTGKPFMVLTLDEHTAEAGLLTRLEAFVDMLERRKLRPAISGQQVYRKEQ